MGGSREGVGRGFRREGTRVYLRLIHVDIWQKPTHYCKGIIFQFKKKNMQCQDGVLGNTYFSALVSKFLICKITSTDLLHFQSQ